jgi:hypothetical protein
VHAPHTHARNALPHVDERHPHTTTTTTTTTTTSSVPPGAADGPRARGSFATVDPDEIALLASAPIVVMLHGAAMANLLYVRSRTSVVELTPYLIGSSLEEMQHTQVRTHAGCCVSVRRAHHHSERWWPSSGSPTTLAHTQRMPHGRDAGKRLVRALAGEVRCERSAGSGAERGADSGAERGADSVAESGPCLVAAEGVAGPASVLRSSVLRREMGTASTGHCARRHPESSAGAVQLRETSPRLWRAIQLSETSPRTADTDDAAHHYIYLCIYI